jgi:hypothetical protein
MEWLEHLEAEHDSFELTMVALDGAEYPNRGEYVEVRRRCSRLDRGMRRYVLGKLIVSNILSLDGYYEGPAKNVMALFYYRREPYPMDESFDAYNAERLRAADTLLLGRVTDEGFKGFWPSVADYPDATPIQREISRLNNAIDKVIISDTARHLLKGPLRFEHGMRLVQASAWQVCSANYFPYSA